ncbi:MAG: hypothetical protein HQK75_16320, partial [Candidatus Magnetomorum sp.]|nr:hypothetical protein [Candidatus Magnetomorum sp.]
NQNMQQRLYQDGQFLGSQQMPVSYEQTGTIAIAKTASNALFAGALDEIRIWSQAVSLSTITANMYQPVNPFIHDSLELYYRFDDPDAGNRVKDDKSGDTIPIYFSFSGQLFVFLRNDLKSIQVFQ